MLLLRPARTGIALAPLLAASAAHAADPTPGYPEPVLHWVIQKGETCEAIATAVYGSAKHTALLGRYSRVRCAEELTEGATLVIPAAPTSLPDAKLRSMNPAVQGRPAGGAWGPIGSGAPLFANHSVQTEETGRADIEFLDRTRIFLADRTLVVIYGTAARTNVRKNVAPVVELDKGEVKAGLAALRGEPVDVGVKGGGSVSAASKDTVVERKGERTTVAVFDGKATVKNAGRSIEVPEKFGTRFVGAAPPSPPRPLPPAPGWREGTDAALALAGGGVLSASWSEVKDAKAYRFEIARDDRMSDLLAREEVPARVTSFRAESIPAGAYFVSVRAIDTEDYLGLAALRRFAVVAARPRSGSGALGAEGLAVTRYTLLELTPAAGVELAFDDGAFGPVPSLIDFGVRSPTSLRLRVAGGAPLVVPVRVRETGAAVEARVDRDARVVAVTAALRGLDDVDVGAAVKPIVRVHLPSGVVTATPTLAAGPGGGVLSVSVPFVGDPPAHVRVDLVDGRGFVLGSSDAAPPEDEVVPEGPPPRYPPIGVSAPLLSLSRLVDAPWSSPTAPGAFATSVIADRHAGTSSVQGVVRGSGGVGRVGFDASLATSATGERSADDAAWLGLRVRTVRLGLSELEHGLGVRVGLPATPTGAATRIEPSTSLGGVSGRASWLVTAGARLRAEDTEARASVPAAQGFVTAGATYEPTPLVRGYALVDAHVLGKQADDPTRGRAGVTVGAEAGARVFGGLAARVSPWSDVAAPVSVQLAIGYRAP